MMKRIILFLIAVIPAFAFADIIATHKKGSIEGVTVVSVDANEVVYKIGDTKKSIPSSQVEGILYDDGRYVTPPKYSDASDSKRSSSDDLVIEDENDTDKPRANPSSYSQNETDYDEWNDGQAERNREEDYLDGKLTFINVFAFGNYLKLYYKTDHTFDGTVVEYRVIYKGLIEPTDWSYLGTTPFAYVTSERAVYSSLNKDAKEIAEVRPLEIESYKKVKKVEFRLTNDEYGTVVVSPLIQMDFTGLYYFISLNKLKAKRSKKSSKKDDDFQYDD